MANELSITTTAQLRNGNLRYDWAPGTIQITQTTRMLHAPVINIGTAEEDLSLGDITTPGVCLIRNLDSTNYVTLGPKSGGAMVAMLRLKPGEAHVTRLSPAVTLRAQANTAACNVQFVFFAD